MSTRWLAVGFALLAAAVVVVRLPVASFILAGWGCASILLGLLRVPEDTGRRFRPVAGASWAGWPEAAPLATRGPFLLRNCAPCCTSSRRGSFVGGSGSCTNATSSTPPSA